MFPLIAIVALAYLVLSHESAPSGSPTQTPPGPLGPPPIPNPQPVPVNTQGQTSPGNQAPTPSPVPVLTQGQTVPPNQGGSPTPLPPITPLPATLALLPTGFTHADVVQNPGYWSFTPAGAAKARALMGHKSLTPVLGEELSGSLVPLAGGPTANATLTQAIEIYNAVPVSPMLDVWFDGAHFTSTLASGNPLTLPFALLTNTQQGWA